MLTRFQSNAFSIAGQTSRRVFLSTLCLVISALLLGCNFDSQDSGDDPFADADSDLGDDSPEQTPSTIEEPPEIDASQIPERLLKPEIKELVDQIES